jgi:hypothetical protein
MAIRRREMMEIASYNASNQKKHKNQWRLQLLGSENKNRKFWDEIICLLSLYKLTVNNIECHHLHTRFHPNPPIGS